MLKYIDITGTTIDKVQIAIDRLKAFEPPDGYYLAFSGGKDSCCIKALADMADVKYDAFYSVTTIDPPELVRFIMSKHPDVIFNKPELPMRKLIVKKEMLPIRKQRYCCEVLKEGNGKGRVVMTGVRWAESPRRRNQHGVARVGYTIFNDQNDTSRRTVEQCYRTQKTIINPIIDWLDEDVWEFIRANNLPYCQLYDEGFKRLGCVGCPMTTRYGREAQFKRWPQYEKLYKKAIAELIEVRNKSNKPMRYNTVDEMFDWWMERTAKPVKNQTTIDEVFHDG